VTLSHAFHEAGTLPAAAQAGVGLTVVACGSGLWTLSNLAVDAASFVYRRVCAWVCPWLRFAAWCYLTRDRDVQPVAGPLPDPALCVEPADLLAAEPFDGGGFWYDRAPEPAVQDVFGPVGFDWFQMPRRDPDSHVPADVLPEPPETDLFGGPPSPAEISEAVVQVLTLATRFTREAAQGGAQ
jgi:hypothetical protein